MLRTLHLDTQSNWRGGQSQALLLMRGLIERGHAAELMARRGSPVALRAREADITAHGVSPNFPRASMVWMLRRILHSHGTDGSPNGPANRRFDIVHAHDSHALTAAWLAGAHRHAALITSRRVAYQLSKGWLALARYRAAGRIIAISQFVAHSVAARGIDRSRIAVVYDGVAVPPLPAASQREAARNAARARWGIGEADCLLGCVSHLSPEKGQEVLIRALHLLVARESVSHVGSDFGAAPASNSVEASAPGTGSCRFRLLLAGAGSDRARLESLARELGISDRVTFTGFVEDVDSIYAALNIFLFPSLAEPLGSSLLDAMACGLPCIAVASGSVPEVIENGVNGLLLPWPPAPSAFADAIGDLVANPSDAARLGAAARETIAARFSADHMVDSTVAIYAKAVHQ
jgi:glycosyltransferase involved in cell wall biosynthesis